jgi:hypothetical protein
VPAIPANGAELNQAWTKLIDKAVSAMGSAGWMFSIPQSLRRTAYRPLVGQHDPLTGSADLVYALHKHLP